MNLRRQLQKSLVLCVIALGLAAYDRRGKAVEVSADEVVAVSSELIPAKGTRGPMPSAGDGAFDEFDQQAEEILAF